MPQSVLKMSSVNETPTFNLKAVTQVTDLKPDTLRAWERRYGMPMPERTAGGHRLYSQHDIDTLKWLIERQEEGLSISRAVALWRELESAGRDPLVDYMHVGEVPRTYAPLEVGETLVQFRAAWVDSCLRYDERHANQVIAQAFSLYAPETVCVEVLQKGLAEIGRQWYQAEITVQQEHFASALAIRKLEALIAALPDPSRAGRIILGCPPEEEHTFSPLLLTFLLRRRGWEVIFLGADIPLDRMGVTLERNRPRLVVLSAQTLYTAATLLQMSELLFDAETPLAYGGLVFSLMPSLIDRIPGHFLGNDLHAAPLAIERLMNNPTVVAAKVSVSEHYKQSLREFRENQALVESLVWERMNGNVRGPLPLQSINANLSRHIEAVLTLGAPELLQSDIEWLKGLLLHHGSTNDVALLNTYMRAYGQALHDTLGADSQNLLITWFENFLADNELLSTA